MSEAVQITSAVSGAERAVWVAEAVHSVRMEGLDVTSETAAVAAEYAAGRISVGELGRRVRSRYGVPERSPHPAAAAVGR